MKNSVYTAEISTGEIEKKQSWLMNILVAFDQLGNALAKGNPDNTISSRIGYFNYEKENFKSTYWKVLERIVNYIFRPIDGIDHCYQAYISDKNEKFENVNYISDIILFFFVIIPGIPLFLFVRIIAFLFPFVKTKYIIKGQEKTIFEINNMRKEPLKK